jgi:hypothetical protein
MGTPFDGKPSVDHALRWITSLHRANKSESHAYHTPVQRKQAHDDEKQTARIGHA